MRWTLLLLSTLLQTAALSPAEPPVEMAPGISLIRPVAMPGRGPDGNTVIFDAPDGLIVVDTGRHTTQTDAILAFARDRRRPIAAIINTHWHLDHGGFLARNLATTRKMVAATTDPVRREEMQIFIDTMAASDGLKPDVPLTRSGPVIIAGRSIDARVTDKAVSDADLWLFDVPSKVAVIGDLATVPVPYFETACPDRWQAALDEVWATPFETAIPGHGAPMSRAQFDVYRQSFGAFVSCVKSESAPAQCASGWAEGVGTLIGNDPARRKAVTANAEYYVGYLRSNGGKAPDCTAR